MDNLIKKHETLVAANDALEAAKLAAKTAYDELEKAKTNLEQLYRPQFKPGQREVYAVGKYAVTLELDDERGHMFTLIDEIQEGK